MTTCNSTASYNTVQISMCTKGTHEPTATPLHHTTQYKFLCVQQVLTSQQQLHCIIQHSTNFYVYKRYSRANSNSTASYNTVQISMCTTGTHEPTATPLHHTTQYKFLCVQKVLTSQQQLHCIIQHSTNFYVYNRYSRANSNSTASYNTVQISMCTTGTHEPTATPLHHTTQYKFLCVQQVLTSQQQLHCIIQHSTNFYMYNRYSRANSNSWDVGLLADVGRKQNWVKAICTKTNIRINMST